MGQEMKARLHWVSSKKTDLEEFDATADLASPDLAERLLDWQCSGRP